MTLEEAEKKFDLPPGRLKQYVSFGFIKGTGSAGDATDYCAEDFERIGLIETLLSAGFSTEETKEFLHLTENIGTDEEQIRMLRKRRNSLLNDIHEKQRLLDSLDFMIWNKKKQSSGVMSRDK